MNASHLDNPQSTWQSDSATKFGEGLKWYHKGPGTPTSASGGRTMLVFALALFYPSMQGATSTTAYKSHFAENTNMSFGK